MSGESDCKDVITEKLVRDALRTDQGENARLESFQIKDFTKKGDNYSCVVTSIAVVYNVGDDKRETSYVAKITHPRIRDSTPLIVDMITQVAEKEAACYNDIIPNLNTVTRGLGLQELRFPKALTTNLEKMKEVLVMENLRAQGFQMYDRRQGLDQPHAILVLQKLGRLHAASLVMQDSLPNKDFTETWPILVDNWRINEINRTIFSTMISGQMEAGALIMEKMKNYEHVVKWIRATKATAMDTFMESLSADTKLAVLNHGDCWTNNLLYRYDASGAPSEVILLDLQAMRKASATVDLAYFLYSSFTGTERKQNLKHYLDTYYASFIGYLKKAHFPVPFTRQELTADFRKHMTFGCITALMIIPVVLSFDEDVPELDTFTEEALEEYTKKRQETIVKMGQKEGSLLKPRLLDMFDEMVEAGIIPK